VTWLVTHEDFFLLKRSPEYFIAAQKFKKYARYCRWRRGGLCCGKLLKSMFEQVLKKEWLTDQLSLNLLLIAILHHIRRPVLPHREILTFFLQGEDQKRCLQKKRKTECWEKYKRRKRLFSENLLQRLCIYFKNIVRSKKFFFCNKLWSKWKIPMYSKFLFLF
jgi:hypothetical protein